MNIVGRVILVLFVAALAGAAAIAFSASQPKEYTSNMRFGYGRLVSPELQLLGQGFAEPQIDANIRTQTESAEVNSFDVAVATAKAAPRLGLGANGIAARVTAQPIRDTLTVLLTARASTPQLAARLAAAYGKQYLKLRRQHERQRATTVKKALQNQLAALTKVDKRGVRGAALRSQINTIEVLREVGSGTPEVIENARASLAPASPNTLQNVIFGVLFGLAVGVGLVALRSESKSRSAKAAARRARAAGSETTHVR